MTATEQLLEWDALISAALGKRPGESINDAALRIMAAPRGHSAWRVAAVFTTKGRRQFDSWAQMRDAAKAARRLASQRQGKAER